MNERIREVEDIVRRQDEWRLTRTINLIASENVLSRRARALLNSDFNHRYAEGHPGARYYQGTEFIDVVEARCRDVIRDLFGYSRAEIRTISGTVANDVVFSALVKWNEPVLANSLPAGGHISHQLMGGLGKYTRNILHFPRTADGYRIDVDKAKDLMAREKPRVVLFGKSLILFPEPVKELVPVAKEIGATVIYDGAHVLGLIAGRQFQDPLADGAEILMGSTHKTFPGPQRGIILSNLDDVAWKRIDKMAFPGALSNHHLMTLPPLLVTAYEMHVHGREYARQIVANARHLARTMHGLGFDVEAADLGYTASHQVSVNVTKQGGGGQASERLKDNDIILNRNLLPHDRPKQVNNPSGVRIGVQEMTRVGMKEAEMEEIARLMKECVIDGHDVKGDVNRFRVRFQDVRYSFDAPPAVDVAKAAATADARPEPIDVDLAGY